VPRSGHPPLALLTVVPFEAPGYTLVAEITFHTRGFRLPSNAAQQEYRLRVTGLAPTYSGLYQLNVTVPAGLVAGPNFLSISGPDSSMSNLLIPVAALGRTTVGPASERP